MSGVHDGFTLTTSAAAPETSAAACEVPDPLKKRPSTTAVSPYAWSRKEPGTRRLASDEPGARMSGLRCPSPRAENDRGFQWEYRVLPWVSTAPTAMTRGL